MQILETGAPGGLNVEPQHDNEQPALHENTKLPPEELLMLNAGAVASILILIE